jgi:hypothetical protein
LVRVTPGPADGRVAKAGAGAAAGKGPRRLSHPTRALAGLAGARTESRHRSPCVVTREGADCRRRRRRPQVRQDRGRAAWINRGKRHHSAWPLHSPVGAIRQGGPRGDCEAAPRRSKRGPPPHQRAHGRDYFTVKAISVRVWFPLASTASTSALYSMPRWRNTGGTGRRRAVAGRSTLSTRRGSSRVTTTW